MIAANELRIDNWIQSDDKIADKWQIERIEKGEDMFVNGIPLTAEILEKCGFEYEADVLAYCDKKHAIYQFKNDEWGFNMFCARDRDCTITIKYLHQLQNLFWSLTGEELEIDL